MAVPIFPPEPEGISRVGVARYDGVRREGLHGSTETAEGGASSFHNQKEGWVQTPPAPDVTGAGDQGATGGASVGRALTAETM